METYLQFRLEERLNDSVDTFRAIDTRTETEVWLERVADGAQAIEKGRFATRARRLAAARHGSLQQVLEVGPGHCVLEAVAGVSLSGQAGVAIARTRQKLAWLAHTAGALAAVQQAGVVHGRVRLDRLRVLPGGAVRLLLHVGVVPSGSPFDDVRGLAEAACELLLGVAVTHDVARRLGEVGVPDEAASVLARIREGGSLASADLAQRLAPFAEFSGPETMPLLAIAPRT